MTGPQDDPSHPPDQGSPVPAATISAGRLLAPHAGKPTDMCPCFPTRFAERGFGAGSVVEKRRQWPGELNVGYWAR